jgi:hypothetical protein
VNQHDLKKARLIGRVFFAFYVLLQFEFVTQVSLNHCLAGRYLIRGAGFKNLAINQDVRIVAGA